MIESKKKCIDDCQKDDTYKYPYYDKCIDTLKKESTIIETTLIETTHKNEVIETTNKEETSSIGLLYECSDDDTLINKCSININVNNSEKYNFIQANILSSYSSSNLKSLSFEGDDGTAYQLTSLKNELSRLRNNDLNSNVSIIDLGECESILKAHYGLTEEDTLIILKKEKTTGKASEKDVEYDVFHPYNKTKLNLSLCSGVNINVYVPIELSEETKKFAEEMEE